MREFSVGETFVNHRIEGVAGRGGMGVVYRAMQVGLERIVALKVIAPALADDEAFRERFVAESKIAASIEHPNVIPVYYAGEREGVLFIVMRYVDGPDLRALIRASGRLPPERAARIVAQMGSALDAAHARGLVHRDVKPANVLTTPVSAAIGDGRFDDHAYLTDFGLTKRAAVANELSRAGGWVGTLGYVPPEQIRGERLDARADIYALGCVLHHALTGSAPFVRDTDEATLLASLHDPLPLDDLPRPFVPVISRALARDPDERYASAGELGRAAIAAAVEIAALQPPPPPADVAEAETRVSPPTPEPPVLAPEPALEPVAQVAPEPAPVPEPAAVAPPTVHTVPQPPPAAPAVPPARATIGPFTPSQLGILATVLAAVVVIVIVIVANGGSPATPDRPKPNLSAEPVLDPPLFISQRPNALTTTGGLVWVVSRASNFLSLVRADSGQTVSEPVDIGAGATSIAAGFDSVWVVKASTGALLRIDARTHRRRGPAIDLATPGQAVAVDTGGDAVWVGVRSADPTYRGPETVIRVDRQTGALLRMSVPGGVQDLAVGDGSVWVTNRFRPTVTRIKTSDLSQTTIRVGREPRGLDVGDSAVWVANEGDDTVTRIRSSTLVTQTIDVPTSPTRVAVGGGFVWVTAEAAGRLIRIVPQRRRVRDVIDTGRRPFALSVSGRSVWMTLLGENAVQRARFEPELKGAAEAP